MEGMGVDQHLAAWTTFSQQITVCETQGLCLRCGIMKYGGPSGYGGLLLHFHPLHISLKAQYREMSPQKVLNLYSSCWMCVSG